jgi:ABC-2 type transport system ATP-binding protein
VLTASHLSRKFGARTAVEDVSFELTEGRVLALLGPNGAGKTTTLRMLAGLIEPTTGAVHVHGEALGRATAPRLRRRIGLLTEAPGLWDRLSVRENLLVYARLQGIASPKKAVDRSLELFDLRDRAVDAAAELSKGLRQRVALARTLLHDPDIVLLDEPTAGLDPESARDVRDLMLRLRDARHAVLISTHNLDEVERLADRVAVLRTRLVAVDTPSALRARLFGSRVRIVLTDRAALYADALRADGVTDVRVDGSSLSVGMTAGVRTPALIKSLVTAGAEIESVVLEEVPLEEVYLRLLKADPAEAGRHVRDDAQ